MFTNTYIYATKVLNRGFGLRRVSSKISLPVLGIDIDGVLRRGWNPLPGALEAINILKTPLSLLSPSKFGSLDPSIRIPFRLLSNGGGDPEIIKANELNKLLKLEEEKVLEERDLILCHTPIRQIAHQYRDKYVLVSGQGDTLSVMLNYGFNKIITVDEYSSFFPHMYRLVNQCKGKEVVEESKSQAMRRLNLPQPFAEPPQIHAIFLISDCKILEETLQIASDLLISKDGIAGSIREIEDPQFVKFYLSNGDLLYSDNFSIPRHAQGTLMHCLKAIHDLQFPGREVEYIQYGKPTALTYQYMIDDVHEQIGHYASVAEYYMIGDNPQCDILGAHIMNWKSILVRSGLFQGINDDNYPATYVVDTILDAITLILEQHELL